MNVTGRFLSRPRLVVCITMLFAISGLFSWFSMPRQEDPDFVQRVAALTVLYPGADAAAVERLVVDPLEDRLAEVEDIKRISSSAALGVATIQVELLASTTDVGRAWDEIKDAMADAYREFPKGAAEPEIDFDSFDLDAIVLAIGGSDDLAVLKNAADEVKRGLLGIKSVSRVNMFGDPGEQIFVEYDSAVAQRLALSPNNLVGQLSSRNSNALGGAIRLGSKTANVEPNTEFRTLEELANAPIVLASGRTVPLREIATVRRGARQPASSRMRLDGNPAVGLGIVPRKSIHYGEFGEEIRDRVEQLRERIAPLEITEVSYAPVHVESRISDLSESLVAGVAIVAGVLWLGMGLRMALVVAAVLPAVVLVSVSLFAMGGGGLHQMSIAALVIALGMLVDNAIVVAEDVQRRLDSGQERRAAAFAAAAELQVPLGTATGTTLAAFLPMLLAPGPTTEWTRAIPVLVMLSVTVSYCGALVITPLLAGKFLRKRKRRKENLLARVGARVAVVAVRRPVFVLLGTAAVLVLTAVAATGVGQQFFPKADRNVVVVDVGLPAGTHLSQTANITQELEQFLSPRDDVVSVVSYVGRSAPHFYYNVAVYDETPHLGQVVVTTRTGADNAPLVAALREFAEQELSQVQVVAHALQQGPLVPAPIEIRLLGEDLGALQQAAAQVLGHLKTIPGAADERHDLSVGSPTVRVEIDDFAAARRGLARSDVAHALTGETLGIPIGQYRADDDPVPIYLRSADGENTTLDDLLGLTMLSSDARATPLGQIGQADVVWRPSVLRRWNRQRTVSVLAEVEDGYNYGEILAELSARLDAQGLPEGVKMEFGGSAQGADDANGGLIEMLPVGLAVLLFFLFLQFDSFRRVGIVLATVPFALTGIIPGLLLGGQPFGFMSLLGAMSLIGIVVNAAIVLLDDVESRRAQKASIEDALVGAIRTRILPIALTTATTGAGLLPLALSPTSLWPPMAWPMISGLFASALLTLLVVPALYRVLFRRSELGVPSPGVPEIPVGFASGEETPFARSAFGVAGPASRSRA